MSASAVKSTNCNWSFEESYKQFKKTGSTPVKVAPIVYEWLLIVEEVSGYDATNATLRFLFRLVKKWKQLESWQTYYQKKLLECLDALYVYLRSIPYKAKIYHRINVDLDNIKPEIEALKNQLMQDYYLKVGKGKRISEEVTLAWLFYITNGDIFEKRGKIPSPLKKLLPSFVVDLESLCPKQIIDQLTQNGGKCERLFKGKKWRLKSTHKRKKNRIENPIPPNLSPESSNRRISYRVLSTPSGEYLTVRWRETVEGQRKRRQKLICRMEEVMSG